jgi:CRP-like cAMP-binding protein
MDFILKLLDDIEPIPTDIKNLITSRLYIGKFEKGMHILEAGKVAHDILFVESGLLMTYYKRGPFKLATSFTKENEVAISVESFFSRQDAKEYVMALEKTVFWSLHYTVLRTIYSFYPQFYFHVCALVQRSHKSNVECLHRFRTLRPFQRYKNFLKAYPELVPRVPQKYVSSYIGIANETLSRYKRKI